MIDQSRLLLGLEDYQRSGRRHVALVNEEFKHLQERWRALDEVYGGRAEEEFRHVWEGVSGAMDTYAESTQSILQMLHDRIEHLRQADSPGELRDR